MLVASSPHDAKTLHACLRAWTQCLLLLPAKLRKDAERCHSTSAEPALTAEASEANHEAGTLCLRKVRTLQEILQ